MTTAKPIIRKRDGFWLEWFSRRSSLDVNIYVENPDGTRGKLISELEYPKLGGFGFSDWESEAISIAKADLAKENEKQ